jgi:alpha-tubulin suppressor-like RCC1 family protein
MTIKKTTQKILSFLLISTLLTGILPLSDDLRYSAMASDERIAAAISGGDRHSLAIDGEGNIWAWGQNNTGQVGNGTSGIVNVPEPVELIIPGSPGFTSVSAGRNFSVAIDKNGGLWAWGNNSQRQLGDTTAANVNRNTPARVRAAGFASVNAGSLHSLAIDTSGNLWTWGYNFHGQLGNGRSGNVDGESNLGQITAFGTPRPRIVSAAGGFCHSLAVDENGGLWAWGWNSDGQIGDGTANEYDDLWHLIVDNDKREPVKIKDGTSFASVAAGRYHSLALDKDGSLWAWGLNEDGELGDGTTSNKHTPVKIKEGTSFASIAAGNRHSLAIDEDGGLWAWGANWFGQLGDGTTTDRDKPVQIWPWAEPCPCNNIDRDNPIEIDGCLGRYPCLDCGDPRWWWDCGNNGTVIFSWTIEDSRCVGRGTCSRNCGSGTWTWRSCWGRGTVEAFTDGCLTGERCTVPGCNYEWSYNDCWGNGTLRSFIEGCVIGWRCTIPGCDYEWTYSECIFDWDNPEYDGCMVIYPCLYCAGTSSSWYCDWESEYDGCLVTDTCLDCGDESGWKNCRENGTLEWDPWKTVDGHCQRREACTECGDFWGWEGCWQKGTVEQSVDGCITEAWCTDCDYEDWWRDCWDNDNLDWENPVYDGCDVTYACLDCGEDVSWRDCRSRETVEWAWWRIRDGECRGVGICGGCDEIVYGNCHGRDTVEEFTDGCLTGERCTAPGCGYEWSYNTCWDNGTVKLFIEGCVAGWRCSDPECDYESTWSECIFGDNPRFDGCEIIYTCLDCYEESSWENCNNNGTVAYDPWDVVDGRCERRGICTDCGSDWWREGCWQKGTVEHIIDGCRTEAWCTDCDYEDWWRDCRDDDNLDWENPVYDGCEVTYACLDCGEDVIWQGCRSRETVEWTPWRIIDARCFSWGICTDCHSYAGRGDCRDRGRVEGFSDDCVEGERCTVCYYEWTIDGPGCGEDKCERCGPVYGDVDGDGKIDSADATFLRRFISYRASDGTVESFIEKNPSFKRFNADVNGDGKITAEDLTMLRRYISGRTATLGPQ